MKMRNKESSALQAASDILKSSFPVKDVILFGSKARGDDDFESDVDILVLTTSAVTYPLRRDIVDALFEIEQRFDVALSPLIVSVKDWEGGLFSALPIHEAVSEDGTAL